MIRRPPKSTRTLTPFPNRRTSELELRGSLLESAFKWARSRVLLSVRNGADAPNRRPGLVLSVEDDGPGIPPEKVAVVLQRGVRGDERVQGHGIGLSIVPEGRQCVESGKSVSGR